MNPPADPDALRARRAALARWVKVGQRTGYLLLAVAVVAFFVGFAKGFNQALVTLIEVCMLVASVLLVPSIVLGYGIKAADKADREERRGTGG